MRGRRFRADLLRNFDMHRTAPTVLPVAGVDTPLLAEVGGGVMLMAPADENADRGRPMQANERRWRAVARELAIREAMLALCCWLLGI